jgi:hypothetical protein
MKSFQYVSCIKALMILLLALPGSLHATSPSSLETLVVQEGGRKKPYLVFTEETLRSLSGKPPSLWKQPGSGHGRDHGTLDASLPVMEGASHDPGLQPSVETTDRSWNLPETLSYNELTSDAALLGEIAAAAESRRRDARAKLAPLQKEAADVGMRLGLFDSLLHGEAFRILPPSSGNDWLPLFRKASLSGKLNLPGSSATFPHRGQAMIRNPLTMRLDSSSCCRGGWECRPITGS